MQAGSLSSRKQLIAAVVAAGLLAAIFVPFQSAQAATVDYTTNGSALSGNTFAKSGIGLPVTIEIELGPAEFLDFDLPVSVTPGLPSSGGSSGIINLDAETFTPDSGTPASLLSNISVDSNAGAYGYGYAAVNGFVGPMTITIDATLKTAFLHQGPPATPQTQTLEVDINTTPFSVSFDIVGHATVNTESINGPGPVDVTTGSGKKVTVNPTGGSGLVIVSVESLSNMSSIFNTVSGSTATLSIGGSTLQTISEPIELDAEGLVFPIQVTIEYNPALLPSGTSESDVKFLHYNTNTGQWEDKTVSRNTLLNTVTGQLDSLSPVVAGINPPTPAPPVQGGGGGGGSGGRSVVLTWPPAGTQPDSYFEENPLAKIQIGSAAFLNAASASVTEAQAGQQLSIAGTFTNHQQKSQTYAFLVQVTDEDGYVTDLMWQIGSLGAGSTTDVSNSWTPQAPGAYKVTIFVWDGIGTTPEPLSEVTVRTIEVN